MCYSSVLIPCLHLQGTIPEDWGASGSLPNLKTLTLSFNFELSGQLPAQWGSDGSSLQNLTSLEITNCDLSGPLPPGWAGSLPSLTKLNLSANALSGAPVCFHARAQTPPAEHHRRACDSRRTAPPSGAHLLACFSSRIPFAVTVSQVIWEGFLGLVSKVYGAGTLPVQWSTLNLTTLAINRNSLTGMIPAFWGTSGSLSQLSTLQMAANLLNGTIPEM